MYANIVGNTGKGFCPFRLVFGWDHLGQKFSLVQNAVKILQCLYTEEYVPRVFAKEGHKAAITDPHLRIAESLVHIGILRHSRNALDMSEGKFSRFFIQGIEFGLFIKNGVGSHSFQFAAPKSFSIHVSSRCFFIIRFFGENARKKDLDCSKSFLWVNPPIVCRGKCLRCGSAPFPFRLPRPAFLSGTLLRR